MSWLDALIAALLRAPVLALLGVAMGLGQRFAGPGPGAVPRAGRVGGAERAGPVDGRGGAGAGGTGAAGGWGSEAELWPGAAAAVAAVVASASASALGVAGPGGAVVATMVVAGLAGGSFVASRFLVGRAAPDQDPVSRLGTSVLVAVVVVALLAVRRGDDPVLPGPITHWTLPVGSSVDRAAVAAALVAAVALVATAVALTGGRLRVALVTALRAPELAWRTGHDPRRLRAVLAALAAVLGALAGVLSARHGAVAPSSAMGFTVAGAEVALLGAAGSIPASVGAATVLALLVGMGDEWRPGLGTAAAHLLVLLVVAVRRGQIGPRRSTGLEFLR